MKILLTKVRPPQRRKDILRRVRLVDTLHQNLHRKLTFVSAPAGYGKTTLLVDFADDVDAQVFWYLIGPDDNDFGQFVRHILASFRQKIPDFGVEIEKAFSAPGGAPDPSSIAVDLINEIEERVDDFSLLVLDDYHLAGENEQIIDFIENLLEHLPDQLRIFVGSRSVYGIPTANLYIRDELITIGAEELRFRADELQRLVSQNYHVRLSQDQAEELARRADGWIVAIMLAVRSMENGALPKFSGAMDQVYDFLAQEVVLRQSLPLREFMLHTSILDDFNPTICDYVLERTDSAIMLRSLEERNLFVTRTDTNEGPSYRYHQLFAEFLQHQLGEQNPEQLVALNSRTADWFKQQDQWELAIRHKLAAGDLETAAALMDEIAIDFYATGRQSLFSRWISVLEGPPDLRRLAPRLLLYQSKAMINQSAFDKAGELLDLVENKLRAAGDQETTANTLITRGMLYRFTGNHQRAISVAEEAQQLLGDEPEDAHQRFQAERVKGLANYYLGNSEKGLEFLLNAVNGFRDLIDKANNNKEQYYQYDLAQTLSDVGLIYISSGNTLEAQKSFREALDIHVARKSDYGAMAIVRNNIAYLYHQTGNYKEAWKEYELGLENALSAQRYRIQVGILNGKGDLLCELHSWDDAEACYRSAITIGEEAGIKPDLDVSYMGLANIERARGNYNKAMELLREAISLQGGTVDQSYYHLHLGHIYLDMGRPELAKGEFEKNLAKFEPHHRATSVDILSAFFLAIASYLSGNRAKATEALDTALRGSALLGFDNFLIVAAHSFEEVILDLQKDIDSPQVNSLKRAIRNFHPDKVALSQTEEDIVAPSLHLEVRGFGPGEVRRDGELISVSHWRSNRAKALFFYILDKQRVRKEMIGLDFWPDFSAGKVSSNFHATLWRVRQALGSKDAILFDDDHYQIHPSIDIWYDVREFETYTLQADSGNLSEAGRIEVLRQALKLYKRNFLEDIYMAWADERRDELQEGYIYVLNLLAERERETKQFEEARKLYERIIEVDPYQDQVHLAIMQCLVESGSTSAAKAHYKGYEALLRKELNAEPLPQLQQFVGQLPG